MERVVDLAKRHGIPLKTSEGPDDLVTLAERAVEGGVDRLIIAGGDGSLHYVLRSVIGSDTEVAILPTGRANDLARHLGIPRRVDRAFDVAVDGSSSRIDVGRVGAIPFAGLVSIGLDSEAARRANRRSRFFPSRIVYPLAVIQVSRSFEPFVLRLESPGMSFEGQVVLAAIANSPLYGGGIRMAPNASVRDGLLDMIVISAVTRLRLLSSLPKVYRGAHTSEPEVTVGRDAWVEFETDRNLEISCDGEYVGDTDGTRIRVVAEPAALKVVCAGEADVV